MTENAFKSSYIARCRKTLKKWGAPTEGWFCTDVHDSFDETGSYFICELCGCEKVRFIHAMEHEQYFEPVKVGCICAGVMEGDILAAKERDRMMKNRAKRKRNFIKRKWEEPVERTYRTAYRGKYLFIRDKGGYYCCVYDGRAVYRYKDKLITDFLSACYAAFDLADPVKEILKCVKK